MSNGQKLISTQGCIIYVIGGLNKPVINLMDCEIISFVEIKYL